MGALTALTSDPPRQAHRRRRSGLRAAAAFAGPAFLVSVGYMDPGNWGTDLAAGSRYGYQLLWVLVAANVAALFLQRLSAKLGIVTGKHLAQLIGEHIATGPRRAYAGLALTAMLVTETAEFLGVVVALRLLLRLPLLAAVALGGILVLGLLALGARRARPLERAVFALLGTVAAAYLVELWLAPPPVGGVLRGLAPTLPSGSLPIALGILGAVVMPHNLYLHSGLVLDRRGDGSDPRGVLRRCTVESGIALNLALGVNAAILLMAATTFFGLGADVSSLGEAHATLTPLVGSAAALAFGLALLAAGLASCITGGIATQYVIDGLIRTRHLRSPLLRRLIAIVPATIVLAAGTPEIMALVWSQVVLALTLPAVIIPLLLLVRSPRVMRQHAIGRPALVTGILMTATLIGLNAIAVWQVLVGGG
ncbi:MAG: Nramp family divalent metal transporter [Frankiaceae bacterium]|jgi:manganese transport protein